MAGAAVAAAERNLGFRHNQRLFGTALRPLSPDPSDVRSRSMRRHSFPHLRRIDPTLDIATMYFQHRGLVKGNQANVSGEQVLQRRLRLKYRGQLELRLSPAAQSSRVQPGFPWASRCVLEEASVAVENAKAGAAGTAAGTSFVLSV